MSDDTHRWLDLPVGWEYQTGTYAEIIIGREAQPTAVRFRQQFADRQSKACSLLSSVRIIETIHG